MRRLLLLAMLAPVPACAPAAVETSVAPPAQPTADVRAPRELLWVRTAAEHEAVFRQVFRSARDRLAQLASESGGEPWAVVADADETLLDNSEYQVRLMHRGGVFDTASWNGWVRERAAPPLPGAVDFANAVRALGGRLVVVTNRDDHVCEDTRANLRTAGITAAAVLCRTVTSDKNPRFEAVRAGTAAPGLGPSRVVMWLGDNIQDFPSLSQQSRATGDFTRLFGDRYFVLPNPMYGSFERNAMR